MITYEVGVTRVDARQRVLYIHEPTNQSTLIGWLMNMQYALTR